MPESSGHIQAFRWGLLTELSDLLNRLGHHGFRRWPDSPEELRSELESLRNNPESDIALLRSEDGPCGYALTLAEPDIDRIVASLGTGGTGDDCSDGTGKLLDFVTARAASANVSMIHVATRGVPAEPVEQLVKSGYREVAANLQLVLGREDANRVVDTSVPDGFSIRPMRSIAEALLLTQIQNRVFEEHWGFSKNTPEEIQARLELPVTGPEHALFIESPEGDIAGYVWTALEWSHGHTCGKVWMTGVVPEYRSLGLGKALVNAGVKHLLSEGAADVHLEVVEDNSPAVSIYEGMGFKKNGKTIWYEKRV